MCDLMRLPGDLNHCAIVYRIRIHTHAGGRIVCVAGWNGYRLRDDVFIQVRSAVVEIYMTGICFTRLYEGVDEGVDVSRCR